MPDRPSPPSRWTAPFAGVRARLSRATLSSWTRRLVYFWVVWSVLLLVHEGGHAASAWRQGLVVREVTVGMGPVVGRTRYQGTDIMLRLVPVAGVTTIGGPARERAEARYEPHGWKAWRGGLVTLLGGIGATLAFGVGMLAIVIARELATGRRWLFGRFVVADAVVLTVFNFFPVPPLDGGRAVLGTLAAWRGAPLTGDALFWVQAGGMALAIVPMTLWTRWTARIDTAAAHWGTPRRR